MLGASGTTLYVCFMGTKQPRDYWADANLLTALLWQEAAGGGGGGGAAPAAHRGFLGRAAAVQAEALWAHARARGLRLVLCGHSLGGAVAQLCTLRLLRLLRGAPPPPRELRCVVFGAPAIGNSALAGHVASQGWDQHFQGIALPGGPRGGGAARLSAACAVWWPRQPSRPTRGADPPPYQHPSPILPVCRRRRHSAPVSVGARRTGFSRGHGIGGGGPGCCGGGGGGRAGAGAGVG
jgi:pimeloyl-ACP methyl ester carboxylesterase